MDVVFDLRRHVKVDDMQDIRKVETLGGDVGAHEDVCMSLLGQVHFECADRFVALLLGLACVDGDGIDALEQEILVHVVDIDLVFAKNDHSRSGLLQALEQVDDFGLLLDILDLLHDVEICGSSAAHIDHDGLDHCAACKALDFGGHCCAEHHCLALCVKVVKDGADVVLEPEIDQVVRFVETDIAAGLEIHPLVVEQVDEPPRGCNDDMHALFQGIEHCWAREPAHCKQGADARPAACSHGLGVALEHLVCLARKFSARGDAECVWAFVVAERHAELLAHGREKHGKDKDKGLSGARVCNSDHVASFQNHGDSLHLNRGWFENFVLRECVNDDLRELHFRK
eukprot:comp21740_c0_seq1/m.48537 comp21740_c0_seq1/g.48537  ORF comp21740_c0_seq1/g.48537 comp21740_c0_seq1/m.48537 type:complete len:342 (+) comp21740_c0_seq1:336-1361(+)